MRRVQALVARMERTVRWDGALQQYVLPHGAVALPVGNAASVGVQLAVLLRRQPRMVTAVRREMGVAS